MAFTSRAFTLRLSRHLSFSAALAFVLCGSSSCHFHSSSGSHDHSTHCDENHIDLNEGCETGGAPDAADDDNSGLLSVRPKTARGHRRHRASGGSPGYKPSQATQLVESLHLRDFAKNLWPAGQLTALHLAVHRETIAVQLIETVDPDSASGTSKTTQATLLVFSHQGQLRAIRQGKAMPISAN
ncbi:MAG: hypothetical protein ACI9EF_001775 [Pseudohongiellaceae bacterium]|jgi:hypothetical protein